jgi:hypothetical protein
VTGTMEFYDFLWDKYIGTVVWNFPYVGNVMTPSDELHDFSEG